MTDTTKSDAPQWASAKVEVHTSVESLKRAVPELWADDSAVDFFLTAEWLELLTEFGLLTPQALNLLVLKSEATSDTVLCLPLMLPIDVGMAAAGGVTSVGNFYASLFGFIGHGRRPASADLSLALGRAIRSIRFSDVVTLQPLALDQPTLAEVEKSLRGAGYWASRFFCFGNWYLPCDGLSFRDYLSAKNSRFLSNLSRGKKRLAKAGSWSIEILAGDSPRLPDLILDFESVYAASWKKVEARPAFIRAFIRLAARKGWLRLGILRLQGAPIAAQFWLVKGRKASIYKLAYREGCEKYSAGSILTEALMQHALDVDRVAEVDYLTGDDAYKQEWMTQRRERWGLIAFYPRSLRGLRAAARHYGGVAVKRLRARFSERASSERQG